MTGLTAGDGLPKPPKAPGTCPSVAVEVPGRARMVQLPHGLQALESGSCISLSRVLHSTDVPVFQGEEKRKNGLVKARVSKIPGLTLRL